MNQKSEETCYHETLDKALSERYLSYALSTITARSLPDVRDGLKPVQRRILYAMFESGNTVDKSFRKSASAVGYVMMKYHPHGNDPIYEAMVRLSQDFSTRYPLIEGQGNFGSIDGDRAAAMRYTEARLSEVSKWMMHGLQEGAVAFKKTYNGETEEPLLLPSYFPNLLGNGSLGIAVGMATSIPPHNVAEIGEALIALLKNPNITNARLLDSMPGPDFPTGGILMDKPEVFQEAYDTGRGSFRLRCRWHEETQKNGEKYAVVTEIPFQVQKARLIEKIADLWHQKKLPLLGDIRDESSKDVRIVFEPRSKNVDLETMMMSLYHHTDLMSRISLNMNVLGVGYVPQVMSLKQVLQAFLDHHFDILHKRSHHRLGVLDKRLMIIQGLLIVHLNLDEVIRIIRYEDKPKPQLMKAFSLQEEQAEAILNTRLRALRRLEEKHLKQEQEEILQEKDFLTNLLACPEKQKKHLEKDLRKLIKAFDKNTPLGRRRTSFEPQKVTSPVSFEAFIEKEPLTIICSRGGWVRGLKGHIQELGDLKYKEGDGPRYMCHGYTTDKLLLFTQKGRFYTIHADKLPGGRGHGESLRLHFEIDPDDDFVTLLAISPEETSETNLLLASDDGRGFCVKTEQVMAQTRQGKQIMNVSDGAKACLCQKIKGDTLAMIGNTRKMLIFSLEDVPFMTRGRGVTLQRYREGKLEDMKTFYKEEGLTWDLGSRTRCEKDLRPWWGKRGQVGRMPPVGFPKNHRFHLSNGVEDKQSD